MKKFTAFWTNSWQSALSDLQNRQSLHQWFFEVKELFFMWNPTGFNPVLESRTGLAGFSVFFGSFDNMPPIGVFWVMCRWSGWWGWLVTSFVRPIGIPEKERKDLWLWPSKPLNVYKISILTDCLVSNEQGDHIRPECHIHSMKIYCELCPLISVVEELVLYCHWVRICNK